MKTLCVAIVVLSFTSVCQPASLACEELVKPANKGPDLSGRWHYIAISADNCLVPKLLNALFWPSVAVDVTAKDTPNIYDANLKMNMYGFCGYDSKPVFYANNTMYDVDSKNRFTGKQYLLLQTGCPDCFVLKRDDALTTLTLFSRRKNVTADELKEFEVQAECLCWAKPQMFKSDHDYETCKSFEDDNTDSDSQALLSVIYEKVMKIGDDILKCALEFVTSSISAAIFGD